MLVLARKKGESIVGFDAETGDELFRITAVDTRAKLVRLGIKASSAIRLMREELLNRDPTKDEVVGDSVDSVPGTTEIRPSEDTEVGVQHSG